MRLLLSVFNLIRRGIKYVGKQIAAFDHAMKKHYHPSYLALVVIILIGALMAYMLFFPPYLGLSNDGSFDKVLADTGLARLDETDTQAYFNYYERVYQVESGQLGAGTTPALLRGVIKVAKALDHLFTQDLLFDVRFLALINMIMYFAALYPMICALLRRMRTYSLGVIIAAICVIVFGDVSIATRLASFYTQPLELILLLTIVDMLVLTAKHEGQGPYPYMLAVAVILLMHINAYCALAGIVFSLVYWRLVRLPVPSTRKVIFGLCALGLCIISVTAVAQLEATRTNAQKYDQMTRGVLFQSKDPEKTLEEFGIEPRYSILTDTYAEQVFPVVLPNSGELDEGFFDKYNIGDVLIYYARHPGAVINLFDIGVHQAFLTRWDYSGNFEKSVGRPPRSKSMFMSMWSTTKDRTAPKTLWFLVLLVVGLRIIYIRNAKKSGKTDQYMLSYSLISVLFIFVIVEFTTVVVHSGDSELIRESYLMGVGIDMLIVFFLSEILGKIKIVQEEV